MPQSMHRAALLAAALAATLLASCGSDNKSQSCNVSSDCANGLTCTQGVCLGANQCPSGVLSCSDTSQCGSAKLCNGGCCESVSGCATSADCTSAALPHCDPTKHTCQPCASNGQCPTGRICSGTGTCESGCAADADCKTASKPKCTAGGYCGECKTSGDCTDATRPICNAGTCFGCSSNSDCSGANPVCNPSSKACVPCLDAQNNAGRNPACTDPTKPACVNQTCVVCAPASNDPSGLNGACSAPTPVCSTAGACVTCLPEKNAPGTGVNGACPSATPVCDPTATCVGCTDTSQCPSGQICDAKACRAPVLASLGAASTSVLLGGSTTLTATLDVNAPAAIDVAVTVVTTGGGTLAADKITIAAGSKTGTVTYNAPATLPASGATATVKASLGGVDKTVDLTLQSGTLALAGLAPATLAIQAGLTGQLTATLNSAPGAATNVALTSDNAAATVPATVTITGSDHASFAVTAVSAGTANVKASFGGVDKTSVVTVFAVNVTAVTPASGTAAAGATVATTITIAAAAGDAVVHVAVTGGGLIGGNAATDITIPAGQTSGSVNVVMPATGGPVVITATANGSTQSGSITLSGGTGGTCTPQLVLSQVFGGGGNSGSVLQNDFIELHNRGSTPISLNGLSVQYGSSATSPVWSADPLPNVSVPAGGYYTIRESKGTAGTTPTPADYPAAGAAGPLTIGGTNGNIALVNGTTALATGCPAASAVIDLISYGTGTCPEGGGANQAPAESSTLADWRGGSTGDGCSDTNNNKNDFAAAAPAPRTGSTTPVVCSCP